MRLTTRADLNLGLICNVKCRFCYDLDHLNHAKGPSIEELRRSMGILKNNGIDTIDLTGGEATVRSDLIAIIRMVKEEFGINNICLITNGFKLADSSYLKAVVDAGVNEFLFSIHGASAQVHEGLTQVPGSFERIMRALHEASQARVRLRVNTTATSRNYRILGDIAAMISPFKIENYNIIMYIPVLDAAHRVDELAVPYSVAAPFLKDTIDRYAQCFDRLYVKYIPFCFMQGYEKHVMNFLQTTYLPSEWDFCQRALLRRGRLVCALATVAGLLSCMDMRMLFGRDPKELQRDGFISFQDSINKHKPFKCRSCKYSLICPGVWRGYKQFSKMDDLVPVQGAKILSPYHFYE